MSEEQSEKETLEEIPEKKVPKKKAAKKAKKKTSKKKAAKKAKKKTDVDDLGVDASDRVMGIVRSTSIVSKFGNMVDTLSGANRRKSITSDGWSWGIPTVNLICCGNPFVGIPFGRMIEIYGDESGGKTTLTSQAAADCQKRGGVVAFVDAEQAMELSYTIDLGVNENNLIFAQPDYGEEAFMIIEELIAAHVDLIIVDSVAALTPKSIIDGTYDKAQMGSHARLMSLGLAKLKSVLGNSNTAIIFTNQTRNKIVMFGNPITTTGGKALKFWASIRLSIGISSAKDNLIKGAHGSLTGKSDQKTIIGGTGIVKCVKNKVFPPFGETHVPMVFGHGFDGTIDLYNLAMRVGFITKTVGKYNFPDGTRVGLDEVDDYYGVLAAMFTDVDLGELSRKFIMPSKEEDEETDDG